MLMGEGSCFKKRLAGMAKEKMGAMVLEEFGKPLIFKKVPVPKVEQGEVLVKVLNCGVCGTDLKIFKGLFPPSIITLPHIMGHEIAGEVVSVAPDVTDVRVGDRVIVYFYLSCGKCRACQQGRENICVNIKRCGFEIAGGYAEFLKIPAKNLCLVKDIPPEKAAILPDAIATSYHAIKTQGKVSVGDRVLIVGCGGLGLHAVQIARLCGAEVAVADISQKRLSYARKFGDGIHIINVKKEDPVKYIKEWTKGEGVDVIIEIVGTPETLKWSISTLRRGGRLVIVGYRPERPFSLNTMDMHLNEWEIVGTRLSTKRELEEVIGLVQKQKITPVIDRKISLKKANEALKIVEEGNIIGRIVLDNSL